MARTLAGLIALVLITAAICGLGSWASLGLAITASAMLFRQNQVYYPAALGFALIGLGWLIQIGLREHFPALVNPNWLSLDDPFFLIGYCLWLPTILRFGQSTVWTKGYKYLATAAVMLTLLFIAMLWMSSGPPLTAVIYLAVKLALIIAAIPALQVFINNTAPDGRFFWLTGLGVVWLAEMIYAAEEVALQPNWAFSDILLFLGDGLVALGFLLDSYQVKLKPAAWMFGLASLLAIWIAGVSGLGPHPTPAFVTWAFAGGSLLVLAAMASLYRVWYKPSESIPTVAEFDPQDPTRGLNQLLVAFQQPLPTLAGLELNSGTGLRAGQATAHVIACGNRAKIYLKSPETPSKEVLAQLTASLTQLAWQAEALLDPLTGVLRRQTLGALSPWVQEAANRQIPVALAIIDLDNFKKINDRYGHLVGDQVLSRLGQIIRQTLTNSDLAIRWGGEEFVLLFWHSDLREAEQRIGTIRAELMGTHFSGVAEPVSFSAGLAGGIVPQAEWLPEWIQAADQALLVVKQQKKGGSQSVLQAFFMGQCKASYGGQPLKLRPRHAEILLALAISPGLSLEQLTLAVYGEGGNPATCKAEIGRLNKVIPIVNRPYRIEAPVNADFLILLKEVKSGQIIQALENYRGELLPGSEAPVVKRVREEIHQLLREAALAQDNPAVVFQAARLLDEFELWERCLELLKPDNPNFAEAKARYQLLHKEFNS